MGLRWQPFDWYETPLYYDIVFDADTREEADFLERVGREHGTGGRRVLEPACGSGRLVAELARRGCEVTGFDASAGMLRFAEERLARRGGRQRRAWARGVRLEEARLEDFALGRGFDLAHCLVSTFKYLAREADARAHLERVAAALAPGGVYVLGLHLSDYDDPRVSRERWVESRDGVRVVCNIQGWPPEVARRRERVRSRLVVTRGEETKRYETEWWFRTYDGRQLRRLLGSVPALELAATYGFDYDLDAPVDPDGDRLDLVLVLRRRRARSAPARRGEGASFSH